MKLALMLAFSNRSKPALPPVNLAWSTWIPPLVFPLRAPGTCRANVEESVSNASSEPETREWYEANNGSWIPVRKDRLCSSEGSGAYRSSRG